MDFALRPPEVNSGLMYAGPGSGSLLAAAAAWDAVGAQLESAASGYISEVSGLAGQAWFGPSSMRMAAAAIPYVAWLHTAAAQAFQTSAQAYAAAAAYHAAFAMTVPPPVIAANRAQLMALIATNFFGQNTPAIAATQAQYMGYWVQDATAMYTYAADSSAASALTSYNEPPQTTNQTGQADQTRAVAQTTANTTSSHTRAAVQQASTTATQQASTAAGVDPSLAEGSSANIAPGGATLNFNEIFNLTVTSGYPVNVTSGTQLFDALTNGSYIADGVTTNFTAGESFELSVGDSLTSGEVYWSAYTGTTNVYGLTIPSGSVTAGAGGIEVTEVNGLVTVVNAAGDLITGPAVTPVAPVAPVASGSSGALGAAPAAAAPVASAPGLAGTAGIQPQLDVAGLAEWARGLSGVDLAAEAAAGMAG